jgi:hypothetical protein
VLILATAGCVGDGGHRSAQDDLEADPTLGSIMGVVVDDQLNPLFEINVSLDAARFTLTDSRGEFHFSRIPVGSHTLDVRQPGYLNLTATIEVEGADIASTQLVLTPAPARASYHETRIKTGVSECAYSVRVTNVRRDSNACGPLVYTGLGKSATFFPMDPFTDVVGVWAETRWSSSQALGPGMRIEWYYPDDAQYLVINLIKGGEGRSPVQIPIAAQDVGNATEQFNKPFCTRDKCEFVGIHYSSAQMLGTSSPVDVGAVAQQRFDDYLTLFYHGDFPTSFTALVDG